MKRPRSIGKRLCRLRPAMSSLSPRSRSSLCRARTTRPPPAICSALQKPLPLYGVTTNASRKHISTRGSTRKRGSTPSAPLSWVKSAPQEFSLYWRKLFCTDKIPKTAIKALPAFLTAQPSDPRAVEAQKLLDKLQKPELTALAPAASTPTPANSSRPTAPSLVADLMPPPKWMPPDVDDSMPAVESTAGCPLQNIQEEAGKRVSDFVDAVNRIAATESLENEVIDRSGLPVRRASRNYSYVASVQQVRPGMYTMEEYRNGMMDLDQFPERIATLGLTALVMVFHPVYVGDYDLACEGLSRWHGSLAWQVHFRQKGDKPARLRSYRVNSMSFPISLRGRAWIAADTFQIVSLETDLVAPVPQIQLRAEHIAVEYMPVKFVSHHQQLWLPESAEIYFDYASRRMHRRHHFRDYMLFAVDERQQISVPKVESDTGSTDPRQN